MILVGDGSRHVGFREKLERDLGLSVKELGWEDVRYFEWRLCRNGFSGCSAGAGGSCIGHEYDAAVDIACSGTRISSTRECGKARPIFCHQSQRSIPMVYRTRPCPHVAFLGLICLAILWDVVQAWGVGQEIATMQSALDQVREQDRELLARAGQQGLDLSESAMQLLPKEIDFANQLIAKRGFSWTRFLAELEQVIPARIAINSIKLDQANSLVHLTGSALNLEAVTALTVSFQDHPRLKDPVLGQHRDAGNGVVEFDLSLRYKNRSK